MRFFRDVEGELECEEAIIDEKKRYGRVRNSLMKALRAKYGKKVANRALWRVNKRHSENKEAEKQLVKLAEIVAKLLEGKEKAESDHLKSQAI